MHSPTFQLWGYGRVSRNISICLRILFTFFIFLKSCSDDHISTYSTIAKIHCFAFSCSLLKINDATWPWVVDNSCWDFGDALKNALASWHDVFPLGFYLNVVDFSVAKYVLSLAVPCLTMSFTSKLLCHTSEAVDKQCLHTTNSDCDGWAVQQKLQCSGDSNAILLTQHFPFWNPNHNCTLDSFTCQETWLLLQCAIENILSINYGLVNWQRTYPAKSIHWFMRDMMMRWCQQVYKYII